MPETDGDDERATPVRIDLNGLKCPLPALRVRRALRRSAPGALLIASATDPLAGIDVPNAVREEGGHVEAVTREGGRLLFTIRAGAAMSRR